jgi:hypothetical protein
MSIVAVTGLDEGEERASADDKIDGLPPSASVDFTAASSRLLTGTNGLSHGHRGFPTLLWQCGGERDKYAALSFVSSFRHPSASA